MELKLISMILLLSIGVIGFTEAYFDADFQRMSADITSKNRLKFGEACNLPSEQERQKLIKVYTETKTKTVVGLVDAFDPNKLGTSGGGGIGSAVGSLGQSAMALSQSLRAISNMAGNFCNQTQNLACLSTSTCGCAEMDETTGFKVSYKREGNACVLSSGSACAAPELGAQLLADNPFRSGGGAKEAFTCTSAVKCLIKGTNDECSDKNVEAKATEKGKEPQDKAPKDMNKVKQALMEVMRSGFCVCAGTNVLASIFLVALTTIGVSIL